jgi:hypothetical protein
MISTDQSGADFAAQMSMVSDKKEEAKKPKMTEEQKESR